MDNDVAFAFAVSLPILFSIAALLFAWRVNRREHQRAAAARDARTHPS